MAGKEFEFVIYQDRTTDVVQDVYNEDERAELADDDVVKFLFGRRNGQQAALYLSSDAATDNGSAITVLTSNPGKVRLRFAEDDVADIMPGTYRGMLAYEDTSETDPADAYKVSGIGVVHVIGGLERTAV